MTAKFFNDRPREYALELCDELGYHPKDLLVMALNWMSKDDVREMLDANELSPRFNPDEDTSMDDECDSCGRAILFCTCSD